MKAWQRIEPTTVQTVSHRVIVTKNFILPNGQQETFGTVWPEGQRFVHIIALTPEHQVIIAELFRPGPEKVMQELPGGCVDADETSETAARRELLEETGYEADNLVPLGVSHKDAYMNASWEPFLATDCRKSEQQVTSREVEEQITVRLISIDQLIDNARNDRMTDALAVFVAQD